MTYVSCHVPDDHMTLQVTYVSCHVPDDPMMLQVTYVSCHVPDDPMTLQVTYVSCHVPDDLPLPLAVSIHSTLSTWTVRGSQRTVPIHCWSVLDIYILHKTSLIHLVKVLKDSHKINSVV